MPPRSGSVRRRRRPALLCAAGVLLLCAGSALGQSSSSRFVLSQSTVNSGGATAVSPSFVVDGSLGQAGGVGEASSTSFVIQSGFWNSLSTRSVITVEGTGNGVGAVTGPGVDCTLDADVTSGDCSESHVDGTTFGLVAAAAPGSQFDGWSGCDSTSTAVVPGDTCQVTLKDSRAVGATFTLLSSIGDRIWRDTDGDGIQDGGEPGLTGVLVTLSDGASFSANATTGIDGSYGFTLVPPGAYTVTVDTTTLPPGLVPSHDADGVATPHRADVVLGSDEDRTEFDFGYRPLVDLRIDLTDSADPLPGGDHLVYTVSLENLGPSYATAVVVTDFLPAAATLVSTAGCAEDPAGAPTCSLGDLGIGAETSFTIEVSIQPAPPASISNTVTASSAESDLNPADNTATETTELDDDSPTVTGVDTLPTTADGALLACETVHRLGVERLLVGFDERLADPAGHDTVDDVSNPSSWRLVEAGADLRVETIECDVPAGDDIVLEIDAVSFSTAANEATIVPAKAPLAPGIYRLFACGTGDSVLRDLAGNPIQTPVGTDFSIDFRADPLNLLGNGHFDCTLESWKRMPQGTEIGPGGADVAGSAASGSASLRNTEGSQVLSIRQCAELPPTPAPDLRLRGSFRLSAPSPGVGIAMGCALFTGPDCTGQSTEDVGLILLEDTSSAWIDLGLDLGSAGSALSADCRIDANALGAGDFELLVDDVSLSSGVIFSDGFESGSTSAWSVTIP